MSTTSNGPIQWQTRPDANAPQTGHAWIERFANAMEARGASARMTGDAIATADTHAREADRPTEELFGRPEDYARELLPTQHFPVRRWFFIGALMALYLTTFIAAMWLLSWQAGRVSVPTTWWLVLVAFVAVAFVNAASMVLLEGWRKVAWVVASTVVLVWILFTRTASTSTLVSGPVVAAAAGVCWLLQVPLILGLRSEVVRNPVTGAAYRTSLNDWMRTAWGFLLVLPILLVVPLFT